MSKKTIVVGAVLSVVAAAGLYSSPAFRTVVRQQSRSLVGWTEDARRADPGGFMGHVERAPRHDLSALEASHARLRTEVSELSERIRTKRESLDQVQQLAEQMRNAWQADRFPVELQGAAYTRDQLHTQIRTLLAEIDGMEGSLGQLQEVKDAAEQQLEELAVRIERTEAQHAALATQREMLSVQVTNESADELLAQVDDLWRGNQEIVLVDPVRTWRELASTCAETTPVEASEARVRAYLSRAQDGPNDQVDADRRSEAGRTSVESKPSIAQSTD